jgi:uncharacterized protein YycO
MIELKTLSDTMRALIEAASRIQIDAPTESQLAAIVERGEFRPAEDEAIGFWFARFLSIRESLWVVIEDVQAQLDKPENQLDELRYFLQGYAAACVLVRIDRLLLFTVADHSIIQRKLNEAFPEYRIPRKQYTRIFSAFVDNTNVLALYDAMKYRRKHSKELILLSTDPTVGFLARQLRELETSLDASKRNYLKGAWRYVSHKWRRRGVVSAQNVMSSVMEGVGRVASEIVEKTNKKVTDDVLESIAAFLQPGDVIITRHAKALTNLFMPGFWPHAAFYVGPQERRDADKCVLEARKDGVLLRPLHDTLSVDAFVVLRPNLGEESIAQAIARAFMHEGKMYNFDFDFFNSDRVVCTELVYRSYDGLDGLQIPLVDHAGRRVLSAEQFLDFALDTQAFTPVAIFGVEGCETEVLYGTGVGDALLTSYRNTS